MAELSTIPQEVNIDHYGGDTLTIHIKATVEEIAGRVFNAQVRSKQNSANIAASFNVIITPTGADIVLLSADSKRLSARGLFEGFWDVQLSMNGADPVTTLGFGELRIHPDVTRLST